MPPTPAQVGRYRIVEEIGRGAMGAVFRAHDPQLDREVAVKVISASLAGESLPGGEAEARFLREARLTARLRHPGIVAVHDAGREGPDLYLVMELVEGESLAARLARGAYPAGAEALEIVAQAADALAVAHAAGVIHRDMKPGNLLLAPDGRVKVGDFGVAKAIGESTELTRTGMLVGSPAYMAPEQIKGEILDGRADLFSLGVVLYELLLRRRPFPADTVTTLVYQILHQDPLSDPAIAATLPAAQAELLQWCLAKDPAARIPDARTLATRARALAAPVLAPPVPAAAAPPPSAHEAPTRLSPGVRAGTGPADVTTPVGRGAGPPPPTRGGGGASSPGGRRRTAAWAAALMAVVAGFALAAWFFRPPPPPAVGRPEEVPAAVAAAGEEVPAAVGTPFSTSDLAAPAGAPAPGAEEPFRMATPAPLVPPVAAAPSAPARTPAPRGPTRRRWPSPGRSRSRRERGSRRRASPPRPFPRPLRGLRSASATAAAGPPSSTSIPRRRSSWSTAR
ncbi:MAG: serine/threonine protein kinase [Thermoanaerobaculia bacterium]|nr:serine/threonine protein kinase [Thermoanaerobaculia bacterium]